MPDKRELYRTAVVATPNSEVFHENQVVSVKVKHRQIGCWVFECKGKDGRGADLSEKYLKNFVL